MFFFSSLVLLAVAAPMLQPEMDARFTKQFEFLRQQVVTEVGRDVIMEGFKQLLADHPNHPRRAEALMKMAHLMEVDYEPLKVASDDEAALFWARQAVASAIAGTPTWIEAQLFLARRLKFTKRGEAREILKEIGLHAKDDSLTSAEVEHEFQDICYQENDLAGVERHGRRLLRWYDTPSHLPSDIHKKSDVDGVIIVSGNMLIQAYLDSYSLTHAERAERIQALMGEYSMLGSVQRTGMEALKELQTRPVRSIPRTNTTRGSVISPTMLVSNLVVVAGLLGLFYYRRRRQQRGQNA